MSKTLTPLQQVRSITRSLAHAERHGTADEVAAFQKALVKARKAAATAIAKDVKAGGAVCDTHCMYAKNDECNCVCGGANHQAGFKVSA